MPNLRLQNLGGSLKVLFVDNTDLTRDRRYSFLSEDIVAGGTTFRVQSIVGFEQLTTSSGQIVCVGDIGNEKTEILRTSTATSPSYAYKEVSLTDSLQFDHPQDTKVYVIDFNRIDFQYSPTTSGTKTTIIANPVQVQADQTETFFRDTTEPLNRISQATVFYFVRFNSSLAENRSSDWSDPLYGAGYDDNTVAMIKKRALDQTGESIDGNIITHEFLNQSLWEARRNFHQSPGKRPFRRKFNFVIGSALTGSYRIDLPSDAEKPWTAENIYGVRIGISPNMKYYDKKEWDFDFISKAHSTLEVPYTKGTSTSIWLANGRDFTASPTISIEGMNVACSRITGSTNSFTITSHGNWSASAGSDAWENMSYGMPDKFTVWADPQGSAYIYFNRAIDTAYINQNIYADYYRTLVSMDSDADILDEPTYDMYTDYLASMIRLRKSKGTRDLEKDSDYQLWREKKQEALNKEFLSTNIRIYPNLEHLTIPD